MRKLKIPAQYEDALPETIQNVSEDLDSQADTLEMKAHRLRERARDLRVYNRRRELKMPLAYETYEWK